MRSVGQQPPTTFAAHSLFIHHLFLTSFEMRVQSALPICAAVTGTAALQIPLLSSHLQAPVVQGGHHETKPRINSSALQDLISSDRLFARAKKLYEVAKLGEGEYNHPTRVIGSAGGLHVRAAGRRKLTIRRTHRHTLVYL